MVNNETSLTFQCFNYCLDHIEYQIRNFYNDQFKIDRELVTDIAIRTLKILQIAFITASFYYRPNTFSFFCAAGALALPDHLKDLIDKIESLWQSDLGWALGLSGLIVFSVLPNPKWVIPTIAYAAYSGYKLFDASKTRSAKKDPVESNPTQPGGDELESRFARFRSQCNRITATTMAIITDYGSRILDTSAFLFLFALKPGILPIAFVVGATLPEQSFSILFRVKLIWDNNKRYCILLNLLIPLILPTYLSIAASLYGMHRGFYLYFNSWNKEQQFTFVNKQRELLGLERFISKESMEKQSIFHASVDGKH